MADKKPPHPIVKVLFWLFVISFFGGGAVIFANLFGHFLPEEAFAIIALIIMAELLLFFFVGVSVLAVARLRAIQAAAKKYRNSR